ncbi:antibiotic biosynthesis monooxygenase family protein [Ketobacter sp.]|uniref:antibiotic biosynthesis monooxygenase family protein n=1 Tax=Ketobacter sp. TaxID=2083498 RepID=UPI000F1E4EFD|nr:antibiotic biosynthesis monooxygenase [Ketobacter sp.]RLT98115.1 MAG: antibiotic biosynthesis monooxygenase [Ketobacter sp.]
MIKVLIERTVAEGLEGNYEHTIVELLTHAENSPGYLGGESYRDAKRPNHYVVISLWESVNAWQLWFRSSARMDMLKKIGMFLQEPERFTILEPCVYQSARGLQQVG